MGQVAVKKASALLLGLGLLLFCSPFERERAADAFESLNGRCIRLLSETTVLRPAAEHKAFRPYLDRSISKIDKLVTTLPAGTEIRIARVVYEQSFEYTAVTVLARVPGVSDEVSASLLFTPQWLTAATRIQERRETRASSELLKNALDEQMAEWCDRE